jgi:hypothetical protein
VSGVREKDCTGLEYTEPGGLEMFKGEFMTKKISQREDRALRKRVKELEDKARRVKNNWGGTRLHSWTLSETDYARVKTANLLDHTVIVYPAYSGTEVSVVAFKL